MLSLRVFGGLSLASSAGPVAPRAAQRRRLALLAVLSVSRGKPVSRDKLVALLWPEADAAQARHLLADSIYVLRDALGDDVITIAGDDIAISQQSLSSDVAEFAAAMESGDRARAVAVYADGGPFLDGVHLTDAPEFERWADGVRARLEADYRRALEELAIDASKRGDHAGAVDRWRQLAASDRLGSRVALELMRALAKAGDRGGALEFARVHEQIVRTELETAADPAIAALAQRLRVDQATPPDTNQRAIDAIPANPVLATPLDPNRTGESPREAPAPSWRPLTRTPARRAATMLIAAGALVGAGQLVREAVRAVKAHQMAAAEFRASLAVLPLVNLSGDDNESFADGMTEALTDALAKTDRLRVIASTSAFAFKGHHTDIRRIADSLHVSSILESDLQRIGSRIRLHVRLVDATSGLTRWTTTYERDLQDVFALQDEIGHAVTSELRARLLPEGSPRARPVRHQTTNVVAYDLYLRGRHQRELRSSDGLNAATDYFKRAIAADSNYAPAYAALAEASALISGVGNQSPDKTRAMFLQGQKAALRAVALDDSLPDAHAALACVRLNGEIDLTEAEAQLKRALELDPSDRRTHEYLAILYDWSERPDDALAEARRAVALDPMSVSAIRELGRALFAARRYDDALVQIERARSLGPIVRSAPIIAGEIYAKKKMFPQAIAQLHSSGNAFARALLGLTFAQSGQRDSAKAILDDLSKRWGAGTGGAFNVAVVYVGLGDDDQAFAWLDRAFDDYTVRSTIMDPTFDRLRSDRRFDRIRKRMHVQKL